MASPARQLLSIQTSSGVPIYRQIIDQIRTRIATGQLAGGQFLPSVRQVAADLEINPMTVSKAYSLLEKDQVLRHVRGQGMMVQGPGPSRQDLAGRKAQIRPLLSQVVARAGQLALDRQQVTEILGEMWDQGQG